jgi:hypothetical protein
VNVPNVRFQRPAYSKSIASMISELSVAFFPLMKANCWIDWME